MNSTLYHMAWLLDKIQSIEAEPTQLSANETSCEVRYSFDDLTPQDRIKVKRLTKTKFTKMSFGGAISSHTNITELAEGIPHQFAVWVYIESVYECKTVCLPKHHTPEAEASFLAEALAEPQEQTQNQTPSPEVPF